MKAAQPFMLIVVQMGSTKRAIRGSTPSLRSADSIVTGSVAALLLVKSAIITAGIMLLSTRMGLSPRTVSSSGSTTKNCTTFPPSTTST